MSSLPLIYSSASLELKRPTKQAGLFSLNPHNHVSLTKSQQLSHLSTSMDTKKSKFAVYSLPKSATPKTGRYNRQLFHSTNTSSIFVNPDSMMSSMKNPEEVDSVETIRNRITTSLQLVSILMTQDSEQLANIRNGLRTLENKTLDSLKWSEEHFGKEIRMMRKQLSSLRRESGMETKINCRQTEELESDTVLLKEFYQKQAETTTSLMRACQIEENAFE